MRLIDADAFHNALKKAGAITLDGVVWILERMPTVSPDEVRGVGEWIKYAPHNSDMMVCSACEKYWILDGDQYDFRFCPNCGAKMEVSEDA